MTTSFHADAEACDRAQKVVDDFFAALDASGPWEIEVTFAGGPGLDVPAMCLFEAATGARRLWSTWRTW